VDAVDGAGRGARLAVVVLAMVAGLAAGCSGADTGSAPGRPEASLEAARTKLGLVQQDPCYTARDIARQWPVCARWEVEVRNIANAASGARPADREITDPAAAVQAGYERFVRAGCGSRAGADPGACATALGETRTAVTRLATGITAAR
jgi:hypothetical protein